MKQHTQTQAQAFTLAEICEAIASGKVPSKIEDGYYTISQRALRQLRQDQPTRATLTARRPAGLAS